MDIYVILKIAGIGLLTSASSMILESTGEKVFASKLIVVGGIVVSASLILNEISDLIQTTVKVFNLM